MRVALAAAAIAIVVAGSAFADTERTSRSAPQARCATVGKETSCTATLRVAAAGGSRERRFFSARHGVGVDAPPGWAVSQHTGYPTVLVALVHPGGSRISVAVDRTTVKDAAALVEQSKPGLLAQGLTIVQTAPGPHDGVQLEARAARRNQALRQLYIVRKIEGGPDARQAVVVTLATPAADLAAATGPFEWVLAHLTFEAPIRLDAKPESKPDAGR
jgi:hypothetical protein